MTQCRSASRQVALGIYLATSGRLLQEQPVLRDKIHRGGTDYVGDLDCIESRCAVELAKQRVDVTVVQVKSCAIHGNYIAGSRRKQARERHRQVSTQTVPSRIHRIDTN